MVKVGELLLGLKGSPYSITGEGSIVKVVEILFDREIVVEVVKTGIHTEAYHGDVDFFIGRSYDVSETYFTYYALNKGRK